MYLYRIPGEHGDYDLYSLGADQAEGGEGEDADVTSW
jgi:general secretion pathway protein G